MSTFFCLSVLKVLVCTQQQPVKKRKARTCSHLFSFSYSTSQPSKTPSLLFSSLVNEKMNSGAVSLQLLFMSLSQRHSLSEGETPMLPDLLFTVKDPVWLESTPSLYTQLCSSVSDSQTWVSSSSLEDISAALWEYQLCFITQSTFHHWISPYSSLRQCGCKHDQCPPTPSSQIWYLMPDVHW